MLKFFGFAHKVWAAWKELDDMPPEECATHFLFDYGDTLLADKGLSLDELEAELDRDYNKCVTKMEAKGMTMEQIKQATKDY